ncbi:hypothetical protein QYF36_015383 [Acer negundo]|nr:hypothetical protein QYF36_015383 [Acer negundo]
MDSEIDINNGLDMELSSMLKLKLWNDLAYKRNLLTISLCKSRRLREEANASLDVMDESEDMIPDFHTARGSGQQQQQDSNQGTEEL